jgi:hypothetical protein
MRRASKRHSINRKIQPNLIVKIIKIQTNDNTRANSRTKKEISR